MDRQSVRASVARSSRRRAICRRLRVCPLHIESLEDRRVLSLLVTNLNDAGPGSLREAIATANGSAGTETILFDVSGTILLSSGELKITKSMVLDGQGQSVSISGNGVSRVFNIDEALDGTPDGGETAQVTIQNLAIANGWVPHGSGSSVAGGGIRSSAELQLSNVTLSGNSAGLGGAVAVVGSGRLTATQVTALNNSAYYAGGAIYGDASTLLVLNNSTISSNTAGMTNATAYSSAGGGVFAAGDLQVGDSTFTNNAVSQVDPTRGAFGGAVAIAANGDGSLNGVDSRFTDVTFTGNAAAGGGAVHVISGALDGTRVTMTGNQAAQGGALSTSGNVTLRESSVSGNATILLPGIDAAAGGVLVAPGGHLAMHDATLENNHTTGRGGAAYVSSFGNAVSTRLELHNSTVTGNSAQTIGGGIVAGSFAGLIVQGGSFQGNTATSRGGAIYASSFGSSTATAVSIQGSSVSSNSAQELGGALLFGINVDAQIANSNIQDNHAGVRGGALYASNFLQGATNGRFSSITIQGSSVSDNSLTQTSGLVLGGGIASGTNISLTIRDSTLSGNQAGTQAGVDGRGGALYAAAFGFTQTVNIERTNILANQATGSGGGGITIAQGTQAIIEDSTIDANVSSGSGGGVHVAFGASTFLNRSTVSNNRASLNGAGVAAFDASLDLENSTVSTNVTLHDGGGVWAGFNPSSHHLSIRFSTITGNVSDEDGDSAGYGGGGLLVLPGSVFQLQNSIVAGNSDGSGMRPPDLYDPGSVGQISYSLIEDPTGHSATHGNDGNIVGVSAMLGELELTIGFTKTHQPQSGSPVVDAADPTADLMFDQRRLPRPAGNRHDIGAVERQSGIPFLGDFDLDGDYDCDDINALTTAVHQGSPLFPFDLSGDGDLTLADVDVWLTKAGEINLGSGRAYLPGDANLDGAVDGSDFGVWNAHRFASSSFWCDADFNADGSVDGSDFGVWNGHKFQASDGLQAAPVPSSHRGVGVVRGEHGMNTVLPKNVPTNSPLDAIAGSTTVTYVGRLIGERPGRIAWAVAPANVAVDNSGHRSIAIGNGLDVASAREPAIALPTQRPVTAFDGAGMKFGKSNPVASHPSRAVFEEVFANWSG